MPGQIPPRKQRYSEIQLLMRLGVNQDEFSNLVRNKQISRPNRIRQQGRVRYYLVTTQWIDETREKINAIRAKTRGVSQTGKSAPVASYSAQRVIPPAITAINPPRDEIKRFGRTSFSPAYVEPIPSERYTKLRVYGQEASAVGEASARLEQVTRDGLENVLQKINPEITEVYSQVKRLSKAQLNAAVNQVLPGEIISYILEPDDDEDEEASSSRPFPVLNDPRLVKEKLQATLTAIYLIPEKEPVAITDWFIKANSSLGDVAPARALREDQLGEVLHAARIHAVYSE